MKNTLPPLSEHDRLELLSLSAKVEWEGDVLYTLENWEWRFESPEIATNPPAALDAYEDELSAWDAEHDADDTLLSAHRERVRQRGYPSGAIRAALPYG